ncbi:MAG: glycosyltransferase [Rhodobacterales bacterium]|nr:glycosyltransferase [Rhodobacterales bacterium]MDX5390609.1 glycosyltransferase [Rhodobacterales bacterium]MDX5490310.1 glycosyltransferase [Rhodobacterales bacterium]
MTKPQVSIVIVSRQRPAALSLCLAAVARLTYPTYEVIVVADQSGLQAASDLPFSGSIKSVAFDEPNIAAARNRGIAQAAGQIVAFIDDDAVPEPRWLDHLVLPFVDTDVAAAGGYVLGRNGISFQWRGRIVDQTGTAQDVTLNQRNPTVLTPPPGWAVKTEGTNMAVRREVLARMGGFDPAFHFYLDETDVNMRLAALGYSTAIVPLAQVHHGYAASPRRREDRTVRDLRQIAASTIVFLRKHCPPLLQEATLGAAFAEQRKRLLSQMIAGQQEPRDLRRLLQGWSEGLAEGRMRNLTAPMSMPDPQADFLPFQSLFSSGHCIVQGYPSQMRALRNQARQLAEKGHTVSLFVLSRTALYHRVRFDPAGYWEQTGGVFGRSDRRDPLFRVGRLKTRVAREVERIGAVRF